MGEGNFKEFPVMSKKTEIRLWSSGDLFSDLNAWDKSCVVKPVKKIYVLTN